MPTWADYIVQALPFGGVKESGIDRMAGVEGLRGCCLVRSCAEDRIPFVKTVLPKLIQVLQSIGRILCVFIDVSEDALRVLRVCVSRCSTEVNNRLGFFFRLLQYPVADNAFEFEQALVKFFYGLTFVAKLQGLFELVRIFFSRGPAAPGAKKKA